MERREFMQTCGLATGALLAGCRRQQALQSKAGKKLNVLFIMDDQQRGDCMGVAGADWLDTPHMDRLAREGAMFTRAYSTTPACLPARAGILTGMRPWNHGLLSFLTIPNKYQVEMPQLMTDGGYRTHVAGKNHFYGAKHGYQTTEVEEIYSKKDADGYYLDDYMRWMQINHPDKDPKGGALSYVDHRGNRPWPYEEQTHPTQWTADRAKAFLQEYDGDAPWFLKFSCHRPHPPFDAPKRLVDYYKAKDLPKAVAGDWAKELYGEATGSLNRSPRTPVGNFSDEETHDSRAAYYAAITHVDEKIGEVLEALEARGELENTLILFTSDHGDMMGDQHLWRKVYAYEPSARVPMLIRWPESMNLPIERGQTFDHLVELRDIMPTFLDAADLPIPEGIDGVSMLNILRDPACEWRDMLELEHGAQYFQEAAYVALTDKQYKYIYFTQTGEQQLFDLKNDPQELHDIKDADLLALWRQRMVEFLDERGEEWVKNGELVVQTKRVRYGPNFEKNMLEPADADVEARFNPPTEPPTLAEVIAKLDQVDPIITAG